MSSPKYRRILLKLSGEALSDGAGTGIDVKILDHLCNQIKACQAKHDVEIAIVIGGGNFIRGGRDTANLLSDDRVVTDHMGMLCTVINGMALHSAFSKANIPSRVQSAILLEQIVAPYIREKSLSHLEQGRIVIFTGGTGNPFFSTDTAAALRAAEIRADALIKATKVDGIYDKDPHTHAGATIIKQITYDEAISRKLSVMDATAFTLCRDNQMPLHIINVFHDRALCDLLDNKEIGSLISP